MKKAACILLLSFVLFSCTKEKDPTIVGQWEQIARYSPDASGQFSWTNVNLPVFPYRVTFSANGQYNIVFREPMGAGNYEYNYATKQLRFEQLPSGTTQVSTVSYLDEEYLIIDYIYNGELQLKEKYARRK